MKEPVLHNVVERGIAGHLDEHRSDGSGMFSALFADNLAKTQQVAAQGAGVGCNSVLTGAFADGRQYQLRFRGPASIDGSFTGMSGDRHGLHC